MDDAADYKIEHKVFYELNRDHANYFLKIYFMFFVFRFYLYMSLAVGHVM